jgi:hypothetical protein
VSREFRANYGRSRPPTTLHRGQDWLNYQHLFYFWVIAREGGLSRAARSLRVTHSTLSVQLRALPKYPREEAVFRVSTSGPVMCEASEILAHCARSERSICPHARRFGQTPCAAPGSVGHHPFRLARRLAGCVVSPRSAGLVRALQKLAHVAEKNSISHLPNFSRADQILHCAETFYAKAAATLARRQHHPAHGRDELFVAYAADSLRSLSQALTEYRTQHHPTGLSAWLQYTPKDAVPDRDELAALDSSGGDAQQLLVQLQSLSERWMRIFEQLATQIEAQQASELFDRSHELLLQWSRNLTSAYTQAADM